jgi:hypothetical protein
MAEQQQQQEDTAARAWLKGDGPNPLSCDELKFSYAGEDQAGSEHATINAGDTINLALLFAASNVEAFRLFCFHLAMSDPREPELAEHYSHLNPMTLHVIGDAVMAATEKAEQAHDASKCGASSPCGEARHHGH